MPAQLQFAFGSGPGLRHRPGSRGSRNGKPRAYTALKSKFMQAQQTPSNRPILSHPSQESELANVVKILYSLWERWLLIAMVTALVLSAAGFYCFKATPFYSARSG